MLTSLGLESLLELKLTRLQRELCADLARQVDVRRSVLIVSGKELPLTYGSLTKVIGLPCAGPSIPFTQDLSEDEFLAACVRFNLPKSGRVSQYDLWAYLNEGDGPNSFHDEFKAKLLLFTITTLLKPTTNVHIHFKEYIPMLNGIECLAEHNWAKFVIDGLLDAVHVFQVRQAKSLGGCLLYLQVPFLPYAFKLSRTVNFNSLIVRPNYICKSSYFTYNLCPRLCGRSVTAC